MRLLEDIYLKDSVEIRTTPEKIFDFFVHLVDDESHCAWHPDDNVTLRWIKGQPWEEGSVVYAEEYIHGKLHKLKFLITKVVPNREIEFMPLSQLLRIYFPKNTFTIVPAGSIMQRSDACFYFRYPSNHREARCEKSTMSTLPFWLISPRGNTG